MSQYDGSIKIGTGIDEKGFKAGSKDLESEARRLAKSVSDSLGDGAKVALQKQTDAFVKQNQQYAAQEQKVKELAAKLHDLQQQKVETSAFKETSKELSDVQKKLDGFWLKVREIEKAKGLIAPSTISREKKEVAELSNDIRKLKEEQKGLKEGTGAYLLKGNEIREYEELLNLSNNKLQEHLRINEKIKGSNPYKNAIAQIDIYSKKEDELQEKLQSIKASGKAFQPADTTKAQQDLAAAEQKQMQMYASLQTSAESLTQKTSAQAVETERIAQEEERLAQIRENAVVGNQRIVEVLERIRELEAEIADLKSAGITEGYQDYDDRIAELSELKEEVKDYNNGVNKVKDSYKKLGDTAKKSFEKVNESVKKTNSLLDGTGKGFKNILKYGLSIRSLYALFNKLRSAIKEGFGNLATESERFVGVIDRFNASILTLKNTIAAAFSPLVEVAIPYIQRFIEWITHAISMVGQFIAALTGRKTYTRAIKQTTVASKKAAGAAEDEADAVDDTTDAMDRQLSPLDKLNNMTSEKEKADKKSKNKNGDDGLGDGIGTMFEEVPIDNSILDFLKKMEDFLQPILDYARKLKDIFMQGFWDGLGDWEYRWQSIKDSLASIKESLIDIWTDPAVLEAADSWAQSVTYMLGSLVGSMASIGLTIATNLIGGIAKYLEQNKERIKSYLISMFNIWEDINNMLAEFFQSFAYVFEAFASEQGQQLTANIIGIFADIFMSVTELASKLIRDIANVFIQPFVDNKEAFRQALEGFLGVLAEITGTIKQGIDDTFDHLNQMYDEHIKPFFDSLAQGLSDLTAQFMEFWNGSVQPILDEWAQKFDALWQEHIQPAIDKIIDAFGRVMDSLKELWENVLKPFIGWIIENILPKLLPIIDGIVTSVMDAAGFIFDTLGTIADIIAEVVNLVVKLIQGDWKGAWDSAKNIFKKFGDWFMDLGKKIIDKVLSIKKRIQELFGMSDKLPSDSGTSYNSNSESKKSRNVRAVSYAAMPTLASLPDIPAYATGQVIPRTMKQHLAILGDNNRETEVVSPLSTMKQAVTEALTDMLPSIVGSQTTSGDIVINIDGREVFRATQKQAQEYKKRTGSPAFI